MKHGGSRVVLGDYGVHGFAEDFGQGEDGQVADEAGGSE
jgi:hypothetical protein